MRPDGAWLERPAEKVAWATECVRLLWSLTLWRQIAIYRHNPLAVVLLNCRVVAVLAVAWSRKICERARNSLLT